MEFRSFTATLYVDILYYKVSKLSSLEFSNIYTTNVFVVICVPINNIRYGLQLHLFRNLFEGLQILDLTNIL